MAPLEPFGYAGQRLNQVSIQTLLIRHQRSVHERVMKLSFGLTMFYRGIDRFEGAASEAPIVDNI